MPDTVDLIRSKRDGTALSAADIRWLISAYTDGDIADEQMSALLMAIYFRGLTGPELRAWTDAMISSGERLRARRPAGADRGQAFHRRGGR